MAALINRPAYLIINRSIKFLSIVPDNKKLLPSSKTSARSLYQSKAFSSLTCELQPAVCDDVIHMHFSGLPPSSKVQVNCSLVKDLIDCKSQAQFFSDSLGYLDLTSSPSSGPSYQGVDPMGLFWSMEPKEFRGLDHMSNIMEPLHYNVTVAREGGRVLLSTVIERKLVNPGVRRIPVNSNGVIGTMFVPPGQGPFPAIITVLGGKGIKEDKAGYLANHGFATLALAYYGIKGLPKTYNKIDIELFEKAIDFLQKQEFVLQDLGLGLFGLSKGGDITLSMASFLPQSKVKAVAAVGGAITSMAGTTSYKGLTIPAHRVRENVDLSQLPLVRERTIRAFRCMAPLESVPQCRIPFEKSEADLLFVVGEDDMNWECQEFAEKAKTVCQDFGKENIEIETYPGMGHMFQTPFSPVCISTLHSVAPRGVFVDMGGSNKQQHTRSQIKAWAKIVNFFKKHLKP